MAFRGLEGDHGTKDVAGDLAGCHQLRIGHHWRAPLPGDAPPGRSLPGAGPDERPAAQAPAGPSLGRAAVSGHDIDFGIAVVLRGESELCPVG